MSAWSKVQWDPAWKGLFSRRQGAPNDRFYAERAENVDFVGATLGKRLGSQHRTGWGTYNPAPWVSQTTGTVTDASGFVVGQSVVIKSDTQGTVTRTIAAGTGGTTLVVTVAIGFLPAANTSFLMRVPLAAGAARIDGLFNALFRNGASRLLAWCNAVLFDVRQAPTLFAAIGNALPETTVRVAESWASTTTGKLNTLETLHIGDPLTRVTGLQQRTVVSINGKTTQASLTDADYATRIVAVTPGYSSNPVAGEVFRFFPAPAAGDAHFVQFANRTHMASANYPPVKFWDVNNVVQRQGIVGPTTHMVPSIGTGGVLTGLYQWRCKFRNSFTGQQSEPSPEGPSITLTANNADVSIPVSPDPQVDFVDIYRTFSGGAGAWFFVTTVTNGTTTFNDNTPDSGLGSLMREFLDNIPPADLSVIGLWPHLNRLFGVTLNGSALVFSDEPDLDTGFLKGESWPVNNQVFLNYDDGDRIVGAIGFFDSLLVFKTRSIWRVTGEPPNLVIEPVSFRSDLSGIGALNQKAIAVDQNEVVFAASDGVYQIDRFWGVQQGFQSQRLSRQIDDLYQTLNQAVATKTHAVFFRRFHQYRLWVPFSPDTEPQDALIHQFDGTPEGEAIGWSTWNLATQNQDTNGLQLTASAVVKGTPDIVVVGTATGDVLTLDQADAVDQGSFSFPFDYRTVPFTPVGPGVPARSRAIDMVLVVSVLGTFVVQVWNDFQALAAAQVVVGFVANAALQTARILVLSRGQWHQIEFTETTFNSLFRIMSFSEFIQPLPPESRVVDAFQSTVSYPAT